MDESEDNDSNNARQESANDEAGGDTVEGSVPADDAKNVTKETSKRKKKYKRSKHKCPFPTCKSVVTHLPRHMRLSHDWSVEVAQNVVNTFGLRKSRSKSLNPRKKTKTFSCPVAGCQSVVKRIHNHLTDVHLAKRGTGKYKKLLEKTTLYEIIEISSESSMSEDSDSSHDDKEWTEHIKGQRKKGPSVFQSVYSSDEDGTVDAKSPKWRGKEKVIKSKDHPSIFKNDTDEDDEGEDWYINYQQRSQDECQYNSLENEPSMSSSWLKSSGNCELENGDLCPTTSADEYALCDDLPVPDSPCNLEDELPEPDEIIDATNNVGDLGEAVNSGKSPVIMDNMTTTMLQRFETWLKGPDGGKKDDQCARQCMRQIQLIVLAIDPDQPKIVHLLDKTVLRDNWLIKFEKDRKPGTIKAYLGALHRFYAFLKCEMIQFPRITNVSEILGSMIEQMKMWSKTYNKQVKERFWEKRMEDISCLRTPEQIQQFDTSELAREAVKILGKFQESSESKMPCQKEYTVVRDYLLTILCINNGSRSGGLANMTLGEFRAAKKYDDDYLVLVKKHKTFATHGPANILCSPFIHEWMNIFITKFRNQLGDVDMANTAPVFLTWSLRKMTSSQIGAQIDSCWRKVFGKEASSGGATAFRKAVVSAVQESQQEIRDDLANLMVHNKATADRFYALQSKTRSAVKASRQVSKIMHGTAEAKSDINSRHKWSVEEETTLKTLFSEQIENHSISLAEVRETSQKDPLLSMLPCIVIRNKIRSLFKDKEPPQLPTEVESSKERLRRFGLDNAEKDDRQDDKQDDKQDDSGSEYAPSVIPPSTTSATTRKSKLFTEEESLEFQTLFKDFIQSNKPIKRDYVISQIEKNGTLKHLADTYTARQLADKVRTERNVCMRMSK